MAWLFSQQKSHLLMLSRCWIGRKIALPGIVPVSIQLRIVKSTGWPITIDVLCKMRCIEFLRYFFFEFRMSESEFRFLNFSTTKFKKYPTGIFGIKNGIGILLPMGVQEIGTKNRNSQPSCYRSVFWWCYHFTLHTGGTVVTRSTVDSSTILNQLVAGLIMVRHMKSILELSFPLTA